MRSRTICSMSPSMPSPLLAGTTMLDGSNVTLTGSTTAIRLRAHAGLENPHRSRGGPHQDDPIVPVAGGRHRMRFFGRRVSPRRRAWLSRYGRTRELGPDPFRDRDGHYPDGPWRLRIRNVDRYRDGTYLR